MALRDAEIRGRILQIFYDRRHNSEWVPISDVDLSGGEPINPRVIANICAQLSEGDLVDWRPHSGEVLIGLGQITAQGIDVVEGTASPSIAVEFNRADRPTEDTIEGISAARIASWERYGVDAIEADLVHNGGHRYVGGPPEVREQAWRWVRYKKQIQNTKDPEVFKLSPTIWGVGVDLRAAYKKFRSRWKQKPPST